MIRHVQRPALGIRSRSIAVVQTHPGRIGHLDILRRGFQGPPSSRLDAGDGHFLVVLAGQSLRPRDAVDSTRGILIATRGSFGIPASGFFDIHRHEDANLIEIAERELCCRQTALGGTLCVGESQFVILLKYALMAAEEPFTDCHLGFRLALTSRQRVVVQGQSGVEITTQLAEFICSAHLHLSFGKPVVGSLLDVDTGCI
jgi:hypothetical protein